MPFDRPPEKIDESFPIWDHFAGGYKSLLPFAKFKLMSICQ